MKKYTIVFAVLILGLVSMISCDRIDNSIPQGINADLDTALYPGDWSDYIANEWPDFDALPDENPDRNAIIEEFTGHSCASCPAAATIAHNLHEGNPSRVFVASIHAGPTVTGVSILQETSLDLPVDFMNLNGLEFGGFFSSILPGAGFVGNPSGSVSRSALGIEYFYTTSNWSTKVAEVLAAPRRVKLKAQVNYFASTKGLFLHTEIEKEDLSVNYEDLGVMVYLMEDSLVAAQDVSGTITPDYVHRDIMRGTISGQTWGQDVTKGELIDGKYYLDYSYVVPNQLAPNGTIGTHNAGNMHLLINVYDKNTYEIIQVIKKKIED